MVGWWCGLGGGDLLDHWKGFGFTLSDMGATGSMEQRTDGTWFVFSRVPLAAGD